MSGYLNLFMSAVKGSAKYTTSGVRYNSGYLRDNLCEILEKLPNETPDNVSETLIRLADNPKMTIYTAADELHKLTSGGLSLADKAQNALLRLWNKVIQNARMSGNQKRASAFEYCARDVKSRSKKETYALLLEAYYRDMRTAEYPTASLKTLNIDKVTAKPNSLVKVKEQNGWHYRMPHNNSGKTTVDRVSVNAIADENLISELDNLFGTGQVNGYYKTPDLAANWLERHDPITIYLDEKATPETLKLIEKTCKKYIRSTDDVLLGDKFAPGLALQKSPTTADIENLLAKMKKIDPDLEDTIRRSFTDIKSGKLRTSAGYMEAAEKIIETLQ